MGGRRTPSRGFLHSAGALGRPRRRLDQRRPVPARFGLVHHWLADLSYWAQGRSLELVTRSVEHSLCLGLYDQEGRQLGVCRWVTDYASFAWLCDVFVGPEHRGRGRGTFLVATAAAHPDVAGLRLQMLGTRDAHRLYQRFGFVPIPDPQRLMERRPPS